MITLLERDYLCGSVLIIFTTETLKLLYTERALTFYTRAEGRVLRNASVQQCVQSCQLPVLHTLALYSFVLWSDLFRLDVLQFSVRELEDR